MNLGERIREIRQARNMTQKELGDAIGLNATRIGHYEMNFRKPKKKTLKAIADALHVGVSVFDEIEVETLCDIKAILFQLSDKVDISFQGEKDSDNKFINGTVSISFKHPQIAAFLKEWADMETYLAEYENVSSKYEKINQEFIDNNISDLKKQFENTSYTSIGSSIIVTKDNSSNIKVKLYPEHSITPKK